MIRVIFFFENEGAFGAVHNEISKHLLAFGISAQILDWRKRYTRQEILEHDRHIDFWVTNPGGANQGLLTYGIAPNRIVLVVHGHMELDELNELTISRDFLGKAGITKNLLKDALTRFNLRLDYLPVRISVETYRRSTPISPMPKKIGYASSRRRHSRDIKRFDLIEAALVGKDVELICADEYHNSWITNCSFYSQVDIVVVSSTTEGIGMPLLEAGAAGCLVLTTQVGCFEELVTNMGADLLPMQEELFKKSLSDSIDFYQSNPELFQKRVHEIEQYSQSYDWSLVVHIWRDVFEKYRILSKERRHPFLRK